VTAALVAGLAGLAFGISVAIQTIVENGLMAGGGAMGPLAVGALGFPAGIVLFGLPLFGVISLTRVRYQPRRATVRLLAGAIAGLILTLCAGMLPLREWYSFMDYRGPGPLPAIIAAIALVTLGAYVAALTAPVPRESR